VASIGHVAVGLLVGRAYEARSTKERVVTMATFGALGLAPDADAVLVALGSEYHGHFGHRGFTHSLLFAVTLSVAAYFVARRFGTKPLFTAFLTLLAVGSHGLLDSMTYRTRGVPFWFPFSEDRVQLPWRMIPPAPFGEHFLSRRGLDVMLIEMIYFAPLTVVAVGPSITTLRRWGGRLRDWVKRVVATVVDGLAPAPVPVPVPVRRPMTNRRALVSVLGIFAVVAASLGLAEVKLKDSRAVAYLERPHDHTLAVSLSRTPGFQHLR
jgi:inner membrane protein